MHWLLLHHLLRPLKWLLRLLFSKEESKRDHVLHAEPMTIPLAAPAPQPTVVVNIKESVKVPPAVNVNPAPKVKRELKKPTKKAKPKARLAPESYKLPVRKKKK